VIQTSPEPAGTCPSCGTLGGVNSLTQETLERIEAFSTTGLPQILEALKDEDWHVR
jgi:hypothetical protein